MQAQPTVAGDAAVRAIDPRTAWVMDDMLRDVASIGTGARAKRTHKRSDLAGKTGTTNDAVDVWFSGYTPTLATTVWMGIDQPRSEEHTSELQSLMRISYAVFCLKKKKTNYIKK